MWFSDSSDGELVGAVVGSVFVILLVVGLFILILCCKSKACSVEPNETVNSSTTNNRCEYVNDILLKLAFDEKLLISKS